MITSHMKQPASMLSMSSMSDVFIVSLPTDWLQCGDLNLFARGEDRAVRAYGLVMPAQVHWLVTLWTY